MKYILILAAALSIFASCKKDKQTELEKLPPETQIGANTFGCLVNGVAFLPQSNCKFQCNPPLKFGYENVNGGQFFVSVDNDNLKQNIGFGIDSCKTVKRFVYFLNPNFPVRFGLINYSGICNLNTRTDSEVIANGFIDILHFDSSNRIISGSFEFSLETSSCVTYKITSGRFDIKL